MHVSEKLLVLQTALMIGGIEDGRALKALDPITLSEPVKAYMRRLRGAFARLNKAQVKEIRMSLALAREANLLLAVVTAAPGGLLAQLQPEGQDAAAKLLALFKRF